VFKIKGEQLTKNQDLENKIHCNLFESLKCLMDGVFETAMLMRAGQNVRKHFNNF